MTLDQYQLCPCGSGKKIKFCCSKDLIHDLERVMRMVKGDQRMAAVEKIDSLLEKYPDRPSLLVLKCELLLSLNETAKAESVVDRLLVVDGKNPTVKALSALTKLTPRHGLRAAVNELQDAFELVDTSISARVYEALVAIATVLHRNGYPVAAKGHLQLAVALSDAKDEMAAQSLMSINHSRQIPLVMREPLNLYECPANVTWRIEYEAAMQDVFRGRWRSGAKQLAAMAIRILDAPAILFNLGVISAWLADNEQAAKALRDFARIREVPLEERVHAMALVESLDHQSQAAVERVQCVFELSGPLDGILERCTSRPELIQGQVAEDEGSEDEPAPRAAYVVCDKPKVKDGEQPTLAEVPRMLGELLLYGKQTDRPARLVVNAMAPHVDQVLEVCRQLADGGLGEPSLRQVVGQSSWFTTQVVGHLAMPHGLLPDVQRRLHEEAVRDAIENRLLHVPCPLFDNLSLQDAAQDSRFKLAIQGMLLNLELSLPWDGNLNEVRQQLGLPLRENVDPATCDMERLPIHRFLLVDVSQLNDDQLLTAYRRAYAVMAVVPLRRIALEVINRSSLDDRIDKVEAYDILSDVALNSDDALMYLDKARRLATADGESPASWLIDEMELRLTRGEFEKFGLLVKEIQTRYIKEPGVAQSMVEVLSRYGLLTPDGRALIPRARGAETAPSSAGGLWTPDSEPEAAAQSTSESKLWIPGMD